MRWTFSDRANGASNEHDSTRTRRLACATCAVGVLNAAPTLLTQGNCPSIGPQTHMAQAQDSSRRSEQMSADASASLAPDFLLLGRFRILRKLGRGGMAVVYAATDESKDQRVALKLLRSEISRVPVARKRFLREARTASSLEHPNVVDVYEVLDMEDGSAVIVMELLTGQTLRHLLEKEGRLSLGRTAALLLPVLSAVGTAHACGIVHRDLKPDNIFIARTEAGDLLPKVLDFGIAKVTTLDPTATQSLDLTGTGEVLGTPNYMSPEQVFGESDLDHRTDLWALGVILYECLAGVSPVEADNVGQTFKRIVSGGVPALEKRVPGLPPVVCQLVSRLLSRNRSARPASVQDVVDVLTSFGSDESLPSFGRPITPMSTDAVTRAKENATTATSALDGLADTEAVPASSTSHRSGVRKRPRRVVTAVVVTVLTGAGLLAVRWLPSWWPDDSSSVAASDSPARNNTPHIEVTAASPGPSEPTPIRLESTSSRTDIGRSAALTNGHSVARENMGAPEVTATPKVPSPKRPASVRRGQPVVKAPSSNAESTPSTSVSVAAPASPLPPKKLPGGIVEAPPY